MFAEATPALKVTREDEPKSAEARGADGGEDKLESVSSSASAIFQSTHSIHSSPSSEKEGSA